MFQTPVLFLIFNREEETLQVLQRIKEIKPGQLFIAADGARTHIAGEKEKCERIRSRVLQAVDWPCELHTLFRDDNLGCFTAVSSALSWFFSRVPAGIILEDDCLPDLSFFPYCEELLQRYQHDERVWSINGCNFGYTGSGSSYGFTRFMNMWGWATWKRVHDLVDYEMLHWKKLKNRRTFLYSRLREGVVDLDGGWIEYWMKMFDKTATGEINTWDYQWIYAQLLNRKKSIFPNVNLVKNIGFNGEATHTVDPNNSLGKLDTESISLPLLHTKPRKFNPEFEKFYVKRRWCGHAGRRKYYLDVLTSKLKGA